MIKRVSKLCIFSGDEINQPENKRKQTRLLRNPPPLHRGSTISELLGGFVNRYLFCFWNRKIYTHLVRELI